MRYWKDGKYIKRRQKMKKSELIQTIIDMEYELQKEEGRESTITMGYVAYLKKIKKLIETGDIDL